MTSFDLNRVRNIQYSFPCLKMELYLHCVFVSASVRVYVRHVYPDLVPILVWKIVFLIIELMRNIMTPEYKFQDTVCVRVCEGKEQNVLL